MFDRSFGSLGLRLALVCGVCLALAMPLTAQAAGNEVEQTITRAYKDLLGRNPDQDGMRTYRKRMLDDNWSEQQVRDDLKKSKEYKSRNADLIIDRAYDDLLGRKPDKSGRETYRNRIVNDGWSEKRVREDLKKSDEYKNR
ncbi:MAG: hypothetical protein ACOYCD_00515 [Kiritimatiellia bacterium]|jgi:TorA maturation chaperone TorD